MEPTLHILHLEDDPADVRWVKDCLRDAAVNAEITAVTNRPGFLAALDRGGFDLLLADYRLPGFDGLEALALWRTRWPSRPFLFVTGYMGEDLAVQSLKNGATDYILKGNMARLVPAIHRAIAEAGEHARRQEAEAALRESEKRFRSMADNSPFMIWLCGPDKRWIWANRGWLDFAGRTLDHELANGWEANIHPDDRERSVQTFTAAFDARQPFRMEYRLRRHDGEWRWVLDSGGPLYGTDQQFTGFIDSCLDLTERKEAEEQIHTLNSELRRRIDEMNLLLNILPVGVWVGNRDCSEIRGNAAAYRIFNLPEGINASVDAEKPQLPTGMRIRVNGVEVPSQDLPMQKVARTGEAWNNFEYDIAYPDGTVKTVYGSVAPLFDEQGRVRQVIGAYSDFTERKRAEEALKNSLHEKEVLLREVHHRVKNNLQVISSLVSLQADALPDPALRVVFRDVRDRVRTMSLVHEKLYASKSLARVDFGEYARSLLDYLWRAHGRAADSIHLNLDLQPVTLSMDMAVPCGLLLNEVATNALKHAFSGRSKGEVTVAVRQSPDGRVHLAVRDNGIGLPANLDWRRSRSLGLQLVQMLAGQLHGTMDVSSDHGTAFQITFEPVPATSGPVGNKPRLEQTNKST